MERVRPEEVGLSSARLLRIDRHLERRYVDQKKIAGALTLVARKGKVAYLQPIGMADLEHGKPMREDAIFRIYSMTKPVASVALMTLYEHGQFQLDDPVSKFIPAWREQRVYEGGNHPTFLTRPVDRPMSIRDLLTHTSGLTYGFMERTNVDRAYRRLGIGERSGTLAEMIERLARLPLEFSPGTRWNYSVSTDVVGHLVEVISGRPLDVYLREEIFEPLGMSDTGFFVPTEQLDRLAVNYSRLPDKSLEIEDEPGSSPYARPPTFFSGGGGLVSTAGDYLRFCRMLLEGGQLDGTRVLGRKTIELMTMNHLPGGQDIAALNLGGQFSQVEYVGVGFGLGFSVTLDLAAAQIIGSPGEYAWGGAASTAFWIDPAEELVVIFMTQFMPSGTFNFRGQLKSIVYPAIVD
ncbi:MAG: serine hydrolase domain-containing protein [Candidatus Rokuibacteriota bacterium]